MTNAHKALEWVDGSLRYIDQESLPGKLQYIETGNYRNVIDAIKRLKIRGAPAIGIAAAFASVLAAKEGASNTGNNFVLWLENVLSEIEQARPTARNLSFAIGQMRKILQNYDGKGKTKIVEAFLTEAKRIYDEDTELCIKIGKFGAELIEDGYNIITHCNTGMLVTAGIGTALGVIYYAKEQGKKVHVYADETRPLLQGARLTTWECMNLGIPVTLICDGAAADVLRRKKIGCAIVGADRIAGNGDVANKIGTYSLAVNCKEHSVPFYVAAPYSTFDFSLDSGSDIPIEIRDGKEVSTLLGNAIAPENVDVYNPAFDITPAELISGIITDAGVFRYPYGRWGSLKTA